MSGRDLARRGWGRVARRGAAAVRSDRPDGGGGREGDRGRTPASTTGARHEPFEPERFERVDRPTTGSRRTAAPRPGRATPRTDPTELPADLATELASAASPDWAHVRPRVTDRMLAALGAFQRERYRDTARMLRPVIEMVPGAPSPRELLGLSQYRLGQWRAALASLEAFAELSGSVDQHPVLMDCERALGRRRRVAARFEDLRQASPDPEVLSEARLVLAGSMADAGDLRGAIDLLVSAGAGRNVRNPAPRHVRQWYVLGDLAERGGDLARARELFARVDAVDRDAYDVRERLSQLGDPGGRQGRRPRTRRPASPTGAPGGSGPSGRTPATSSGRPRHPVRKGTAAPGPAKRATGDHG